MIRRNLALTKIGAELLLWRHGWSWAIAGGLLAVAMAIHLTVIRPAEVAAETLDAARLNQVTSRTPGPVSSAASKPVGGLRQVIERSPAVDALAQRLLVLAQAQAIALPRADYQQRAHGILPVMQLRVSQPVRATYPQLRRYIESVLREVPNASLDQVTASRVSVDEAELEIRLQWSFWMPAAQRAPGQAGRIGE